MSITVHREVDPFFEGLWAVRALCCGEGPRAQATRLTAKHPDRAGAIQAAFAPLLKLQDALEAAFDLTDEDLRFLFGPREDLGCPLCDLFQLPPEYGSPDDALVRQLFAGFLLSEADATAFPTDAALTGHINALPHSMAVKSALLFAFHHYRALLDFARQTAARAMDVITAHSAVAAPLLEEAAQVWEARLAEEGGLSRAFDELGIPIAPDDGTYLFSLSLLRATGLTMLELDEKIYIFCGVLMGADWGEKDDSSPERLQEVLKALSDKTKWEIMRLIRTERIYGSQLAERLGLTAATISHHLSQLASLGLIRLVKEGGRYYCEPDRAAAERLLAALRARLLS